MENRPPDFSIHTRQRWLQQAASEQYDLLVVGGGITGAGIALDAASRGMKVILVEKEDFAAGTSSRSTKLIHGGLRYLKQFDIRLVREVCRERSVLHRNAPFLVKPEKMLLPVVKGGNLSMLTTRIALWLYDWLAGVKPEDRKQMLSRRAVLNLEPLLDATRITGGGLYTEYRTDDARLVITVIKTAVHYGAHCLNYTGLSAFVYEKDKIAGGVITDRLTGKTYTIHARVVVNAAGPWVDELRQKNHSLQGKRLHLTKGVHIVVPYDRLPVREALYFDAVDRRMIFAIPRGRVTYVGTTDTDYTGDKDNPVATRQDVEYLLESTNRMFPAVRLTVDDVESSWAGLRPLIHEEGKSPSELSRKDEIFISPSGLITIAGGKLTGYRKMAERTVNLVAEKLETSNGGHIKPCMTATLQLLGSTDTPGNASMFLAQLKSRYPAFDRWAGELYFRHGIFAEMILSAMKAMPQEDMAGKITMAELDYSIRHECVITPADFLIRRTGMLYFNRPETVNRYMQVTEYLQQKSPLDSQVHQRHLQAFEKALADTLAFKAGQQ